MKHFILNPTLIKAGDEWSAGLIKTLIAKKGMTPLIEQGRYKLKLNSQLVEVTLTHDLAPHWRDKKSGICLEVLPQEQHSSGGQAKIFCSLGKLVPERGYSFTPALDEEKQRVVKYYDDDETSASEWRHVPTYAGKARFFPHLHAKPPTVSSDKVTVVMRKIPGIDLFSLLDLCQANKITLTTGDRFKLSIAFITALQNEFHKRGYLHRDIKPENVMVDLKTYRVTMIDPDFSAPLDAEGKVIDKKIVGSYEFISPEILKAISQNVTAELPYTLQSDLYAAGLVLAQIWGDWSSFPGIYWEQLPSQQVYAWVLNFHQQRKWDGLFKNTAFSEQDTMTSEMAKIKVELENLFNRLTNLTDPIKRGTLDEALLEMEMLDVRYQTEVQEEEWVNSLSALTIK
ncbi:protein kinase domain-containing protein [Legionella shakespearei]|uniref:Protein kinase domain-containing protein n=1 Tax=Legionella shakespearei DSM 23087 TaxID=1122169 RepID=A0A0W0YIV1_9GAMM|nr:protein kinase [Legionella shakespearei]KTD56462.1 putative protein kinase [Legionella shakespearei DSM 23087]